MHTREKNSFKCGYINYEDAFLFKKKKKLELYYEMNFLRKYKVTVTMYFMNG